MKDPTPNLTRLRTLEAMVNVLGSIVEVLVDNDYLAAEAISLITDRLVEQDRAQAELAETH